MIITRPAVGIMIPQSTVTSLAPLQIAAVLTRKVSANGIPSSLPPAQNVAMMTRSVVGVVEQVGRSRRAAMQQLAQRNTLPQSWQTTESAKD
jgi:hypothetical protein